MFKTLLIRMMGVIALTMLLSCAGMAPEATCPDIGGTYADLAQDGKASLVNVLTGQKAPSTGTVELTAEATSLRIETSQARHTLRSPADFSCAEGIGMTLTRQRVEHVRLPPLIDQTRVTSYRFQKTSAGDLQMDVYSQTTASPYGLRLTGPQQLDHTVIWSARPRR
ncbi:MAG: hypothetical protein EOP02_16070 [Proteobacteria bacterium]|nr:MAG: hypothetical protein EOP02_16070 [Pseudomonadota bacterium]